MKPITRIDYYLATITNDEDAVTPLPEPITRIDFYLAKLAGENIAELPEPVTRIDLYLASLCGMDVVLPEEPVTRIDFYLAALNNEAVDTPEPVTRIDYYLNNWAQGGGMPDWQTFSGNPLQFNAPKAHTLKSVSVEFSPKQSGTGDPSPDNVRPISGWTGLDIYRAGENLAEVASPATAQGYAASVDGGFLTLTKTAETTGNRRNFFTKTFADMGLIEGQSYSAYCEDAEQYSWKCGIYNGSGGMAVLDIHTTAYTFTYTTAMANYRLGMWTNSPNDAPLNTPFSFHATLVLGSTAPSEWHPYTGHTYSVTWQDEAGTVYGGTIDLTTGVLTVTWEKKKVSDINLTLIARNGADNAYWIRSQEYSYLNDNGSSNAFCDTFKPIKFPSKAYSGNGLQNNECSVHNARFQFCTADHSTIASFKAAYGDVEICYPITTLVTYQLTPTQIDALLGINTMWTDGSNLTVEARGEAVNLNALQSLNMLLGGRYVNNHTPEDLTDEEALDIILNGGNR